jgi:hypothetical protein
LSRGTVANTPAGGRVAILRVRKERNRTPAEEDVNKAGSAGVGVLPDSRRWAV